MGVWIRMGDGSRVMRPEYSSPYGRFRGSEHLGKPVRVFGRVRVSMNSVSAGHVQLVKNPANSLREERKIQKEGIDSFSKELIEAFLDHWDD